MFNLKTIRGKRVLTGIDSSGAKWKQFELDYNNKNSDRELCMTCNAVLEFGWKQTQPPNMKVCDDEVSYASKRSYYFPNEIDKKFNSFWTQ